MKCHGNPDDGTKCILDSPVKPGSLLSSGFRNNVTDKLQYPLLIQINITVMPLIL